MYCNPSPCGGGGYSPPPSGGGSSPIGGGAGGDSIGGGGGGGGDPPPAPIPSASPGCTNGSTKQQDINNTAEKQMHDHLANSVSQNQEWAGFIYENSSGSLVSVGQYYNTNSNGEAIGFPSSPPAYSGWTAVGWFHDHPTNFANSDDPTGIQGAQQVAPGQPYSGDYFSAADEEYSNGNNLTGYVGLENEYGNQWGMWKPGGTVGQQTNYTDEEGLQSGC